MKTRTTLAAALAIAVAAPLVAETADNNWAKLCAACHGKDGAGHTRAGKKLDVKDLTAAANQKMFTDDDAFAALKKGLTAPDGAEKMKPFADKLSDDEIKALVTYVRALAK